MQTWTLGWILFFLSNVSITNGFQTFVRINRLVTVGQIPTTTTSSKKKECNHSIIIGNKQMIYKRLRLQTRLMSSQPDHDNNAELHTSNITSTTPIHSDSKLKAPTVRDIIQFAIPAIGIWLFGPLLSLIDTSAVGLLAGTSQLAALNPAITITDDGSLLVSFMYTATTNLIAAEFDKSRIKGMGTESTARQMKNVLQLATFVGIILGTGLWTFSTFFIKALLGSGHGVGHSVEVLSAAQRYVKIRALGMPAAVVIGTAQSACLGMKDTKTPLLVMMSAALVNLVCDFLFVGNNIPWIGGAAGAAWATTFSQYAALAFFMRWLQSGPKDDVNGEGGVMRILDQSSKGILHAHMKFIDLIQFPTCMETLKKVWAYFVPVTTTSIGRVSGYIAMSYVVSSTFGTVHMAAQQIVLAFFLCFIPMCDSLNLTAQSFVPGIFDYTGNRRLRLHVMKETIRNFLKAGVAFGIALTAIVMTMPLVSHLFSHDPAVIASVNSTTPYLAIMFALSGIVCSGEGLLLGQKDLSFLSKTFGVFFFVLPLWLLRIKHGVLSGVKSAGLGAVWRVFSIYQITRCVLWLARLVQLMKRDEKVLLEQEK